jgi:glyceraldehyde-3-phosphate dehydrogenase/erythrose-4-phosphate dehydrogenase
MEWDMDRITVAVNGCGVIGKRVADAVRLQDDMALAGVADIVDDYRLRVADQAGLQANYASALGRSSTRVVSCNTTSFARSGRSRQRACSSERAAR